MIHRFVDLAGVCSPPFTAYQGAGGDPQVWMVCSDDAPGFAKMITDFSGFTDADQCHNPVLSPDGTKILFEVLNANTSWNDIWVVDNSPGSTPTQLVTDASNNIVHPAWGADSDTFVYVHCVSTLNGTIYKDTVSSPGSPTALKSPSGSSPWRPQFNYDGTRVAYIYDNNTSAACDLRCMDADGSNDASLDNTIGGYSAINPPQFGWANASSVIAYHDGVALDGHTYVINDDGTGKTQLDDVGDAATATTFVSMFPFAPDDSFVVITGNIGAGYISVFRAELDGSDTTELGASGPENRNNFRGAIVHNDRIWFIPRTNSTSRATVASMGLDGTGETTNLDNSLGPGNIVADFTNGDGWHFL